MKLYPKADAFGVIPSLWTGEPVGSNGGGITYHYDDMSAGKSLPFYMLQTSPVIGRSTIHLSGQHYLRGATGRDYSPHQVAVIGVPIKGSGTIPYDWVFNDKCFAFSGRRQVDFNPSGIQSCGLGVAYAYVYRPSTNSVVGVLAKLGKTLASWVAYLESIGNLYTSTNGGGGSWDMTNWKVVLSDANRNNYFTLANVEAQDGDYVCYELWVMCGTSVVNAGAKGWYIDLDVGWTNATTSTDQGYTWNTATRVGDTFVYWDDLKAGSGITGGMPYSPGPVNLTNVTPLEGSGIRMTFDAPVGVLPAYTIGPPTTAGRLTVTGAHEVTDTQIDVSLAVNINNPQDGQPSLLVIP